MCVRVARAHRSDDGFGAATLTCHARMVGGKTRTRQPAFQAAGLPAPARLDLEFLCAGPGQGVVPPFPRQCVAARPDTCSQRQPGTAARAQDGSKGQPRARRRTVDRLAQGQAVGVVGDFDPTAEFLLHIDLQGLAVEHLGVGAPHALRACVDATGNADAHRHIVGQVKTMTGLRHQLDHGIDDGGIAVARRGRAFTPPTSVLRVEHHDFGFGAAQVHADAVGCGGGGQSRRHAPESTNPDFEHHLGVSPGFLYVHRL